MAVGHWKPLVLSILKRFVASWNVLGILEPLYDLDEPAPNLIFEDANVLNFRDIDFAFGSNQYIWWQEGQLCVIEIVVAYRYQIGILLNKLL